ncbi:MAG: ATP-dependent Zn protease [Cyanobacterium sp. T60_A2020_053]|nr:ATP-dependent Zn protease [Cyanobacterium sp. T60_A2020_053]
MQQTGLNILAISIFTITLSVLLGPLINLSPFIPATITFVLLGLVTIDTLNWQNQGINLLVDIFASAEQKERIIFHEAGHFLTAHVNQIPIQSYTLSAWETLTKKNTGSGGVIFDTEFLQENPQDMREKNLMLERVGVVLMAGIAAEKIFYESSQGGEEDKIKFQQIYSQLSDGIVNVAMRQRLAILQATTIIETHQEAYLKLVELMKQRKTVTECQEFLTTKFSL